ncbi:MAG: DUF1573 domain-containing protein, partial [Desulfobacterales bacterium]|nr:DUF1573 domain-containing protein [Desulfobacterales bacterium]
MKRILQLVMVFSFVLAVSTAVAQEKAKIVFETLEHDFGSFKESDGTQTTIFKFTNKGGVPLVLNNVRASCGCTTPKWTREPVAPGAAGEIEVSYNPRNRPGSFNKSVTVQSNAENATIILSIKGQVQQREKTLAELYPRLIGDLRVKTNHISFSKMTQTETKTDALELVNDSDNPITVGFHSVPEHLKAKVEPETIPAKGRGKLIVTYDAGATNTYGFASHRIYLSLNGSNDYKNSVGVSATIEEDFSKLTPEQLANAPVATFPESSHDFGDMKQGDKKEDEGEAEVCALNFDRELYSDPDINELLNMNDVSKDRKMSVLNNILGLQNSELEQASREIDEGLKYASYQQHAMAPYS